MCINVTGDWYETLNFANVAAPSELVFVFTNFQPGIKTPDLFVLPSLCTGAADTINNEVRELTHTDSLFYME